jgi:hypothetical protein
VLTVSRKLVLEAGDRRLCVTDVAEIELLRHLVGISPPQR